MAQAYPEKLRGDESIALNVSGTRGKTFHFASTLAEAARRLWPNKTEFSLAIAAGAKPDAARKWVGGDHAMNGNALAALIRSEDGYHFVKAIAADAPWWPKLDAAAQLAAVQADLDAQLKRINSLAKELDA